MQTDKPSIDSIFLAAVELPAEERPAYLENACGDDSELQARVERLLGAQSRVDSFLESPAPELGATVESPITEKPGTQIGPYKLREQIGEGGFGTVYVAEQEKPVARKVALKVIKPGMDTRAVVARFEAERQALALMDHPNIARVLDAGATESGRPYFVMELVKGTSLTEFCDAQKLGTRERLQLFVEVCRAVQHAHQKGIIHRDLKPSNVMVTMRDDRAIPKVIDFGVAKALSQKLTEKTVYTGYGQLIGTPLYMSPEQAQMNEVDVDTRSDVYSLGILLYELLTGTTPFDGELIKQASCDELRRIIREDEPPRPSDRISTLRAEQISTISDQRKIDAGSLARLLRGELDWIVMKALEKDRNRRYESASAFAADVERYLNDAPVQACPPSFGYRFRKYARRNKADFAMASIIALALFLVVGSVGWAVRDRMAREQQSLVERQARQTRLAEQVDLLFGEVDRLIQEKNWPQAMAMAKRAEAIVHSGDAAAHTREPLQQLLSDLTLVQQLEEARLLEGQSKMGNWDLARADKHIRDALLQTGFDIDAVSVPKLADELRTRPRILAELATALTYWATVRRGLNPDNQVSHWRDLLDIADAVDANSWGRRIRAIHRTDRSETAALKQLADAANVTELNPAMLHLLAKLLRDRVSADEAAKLLLKARRHYADDFWINFELAYCLADSTPPRLSESLIYYHVALAIRPATPNVHGNIGVAFNDLGMAHEAIAEHRIAVDLDPKDPASHNNLGVALKADGKLDEAVACYRRALELDPKYPQARCNLGQLLYEQGNLESAIDCFRQTIEISPTYVDAHVALGVALKKQGELDEAIASFRRAISINPKNTLAHNNLGDALHHDGKLNEAIVAVRAAIDLDPKYAEARFNLGVVLNAQGKLDEAIVEYRTAVELDPKHGKALANLGVALSKRGEVDEAIACYRAAIELDPTLALPHLNLGVALVKKDRLDEAISCFEKAVEIDPQWAEAYGNLGLALKKKGNIDDAIAVWREMARIDPTNHFVNSLIWTITRPPGRSDGEYAEALQWAEASVKMKSAGAREWQVLGWALYRNRQWQKAVDALQESVKLQGNGGDPHQWLFLAMAHWQLGEQQEAKTWFEKAVVWMERRGSKNSEARAFRSEAEQLMGLTENEGGASLDD